EPAADVLEELDRARVTVLRGLGDHRPDKRLDLAAHPFQQGDRDRRAGAGQLLRLPAQHVAGGVLLEAAAIAAFAPVAIGDDDHVTELPSHAVAAALDGAVHDDPAADARTEGDHHQV